MQEYNNGIAHKVLTNIHKSIDSTAQPTMFGGDLPRRHPKAGLLSYGYPATLAVGSATRQPNLLGSGFWKDFGKGFKQGLVGSAQVAAPIVGELAKDAAASYLRGGVARKRGGKYSVGKFFKDAGDVLHPIYKEVAPVAKDVAVSVAKDAIKSYLQSGGAMVKNRPDQYTSGSYPKALMSYQPDSHMYGGYESESDTEDDDMMMGGDLKHYWAAVKSLASQEGISIKDARQKIKSKTAAYEKEAPKKRGANKRTKGKSASMDALVESLESAPKKARVKAQTKAAIAHLLQYAPVKKPRVKKTHYLGVKPEMVASGRHNFLDDAVKVSKAVAPFVPLLLAAGRKNKEMTLPKSAHKRYMARGDIVAEVMKKMGLSLPDASRYVKQHGLY